MAVVAFTSCSYRLTQISLVDGGQYTCSATNEAGKATAVGTINVQTYPEVSIIPNQEELTIREGQYLRLECRAEGVPKPTIQWIKPENEYGAE